MPIGLNKADLKQGEGEYAIIIRLGILFLCFAVMLIVASSIAVVVSGYFEKDTRWYYLSQNICQCAVGFIGTAVAAAYFMSRRPWRFIGVDVPTGVNPYIGVLIVYLISIPALDQLVLYNSEMRLPPCLSGIERWMRQMEDSSAALTDIILNDTTVSGLISGILVIGILTGLAEELLFRGALQRTLSTFPPLRHISMWIAAFIFSAVHLQFFGFFPRFVMGLFFGYLFYSTGSIWPCVFAHALNNSMVVVMKWLELRGCDLNAVFHKWGVVESGFPIIPFISLLLMILFFSLCYDRFFSAKSPVEDSRTKVL